VRERRDYYFVAVAIAFDETSRRRIPDTQQRANSTARGLYSPLDGGNSSRAELRRLAARYRFPKTRAARRDQPAQRRRD